MPKCKFAPKQDRREKELISIIDSWCARKRMSKTELAKKVKIPYPTLMDHIYRIERMRYVDIIKIFDALGVPNEERMKVL